MVLRLGIIAFVLVFVVIPSLAFMLGINPVEALLFGVVMALAGAFAGAALFLGKARTDRWPERE